MTDVTPDALAFALMAMDTYNQGLNPHILDNTPRATPVFTVLNQSANAPGFSSASGFSATAYEYNGKVVISFRGTNFNSYSEIFQDANNGWPLARGDYAGAPQAAEAIAYYRYIRDNFANGQDIELTGHSLGAGLAGYVAALYGKKAILFDPMTFETGAQRTQSDAQNDPALASQIYGTNAISPIDTSGIVAYETSGEVLEALRLAETYSIPTTSVDPGVGLINGINPLNLHTMALQVMLDWAQINSSEEWLSAAPELLVPLLSSNTTSEIVKSLERPFSAVDSVTGIIEAIAYSSSTGSQAPYGTSAIDAFFNDGRDLGKAQADIAYSNAFKNGEALIGAVVVEYSAELALTAATGGNGQNGILKLSDTGNTLSVDFSSNTWSSLNGGSGSVFKGQLISASLKGTGVSDFNDELNNYEVREDTFSGDIYDKISSVTYQVADGSRPEEPVTTPGYLDAFFVSQQSPAINLGSSRAIGVGVLGIGSASSDAMTGGAGDDLMLGGGGDDTLNGGAGADILDGGIGDDVLYGVNPDGSDDGSSDYLDGGSGADKFFVGNGDIIASVDYADRVTFGSVLTGGTRDPSDAPAAGNESGTYKGADDTIYTYDEGAHTLTVQRDGQAISINGFTNGEAGIVLSDDKNPNQNSTPGPNPQRTPPIGLPRNPPGFSDPLVLDLAGAGINLSNLQGSMRISIIQAAAFASIRDG